MKRSFIRLTNVPKRHTSYFILTIDLNSSRNLPETAGDKNNFPLSLSFGEAISATVVFVPADGFLFFPSHMLPNIPRNLVNA